MGDGFLEMNCTANDVQLVKSIHQYFFEKELRAESFSKVTFYRGIHEFLNFFNLKKKSYQYRDFFELCMVSNESLGNFTF